MTCEVITLQEWSRFHPEFYERNEPVVVRGLAESGARIFDWSVQRLQQVLGDAHVPILTSETGFLSYERNTEEMPFARFARDAFALGTTPARHLYFKNPVGVLPDGQDDSDAIPQLAPYVRKAVMRNLWISGPGITVGLHFDAAENFNIQLKGRKSFRLYAPGTRAYYPMPMLSQTAHISRVFREGPSPDLSRFPRFDPGCVLDIELDQGEMLYLPAYWWHQVSSLGDENINLNFWWLPSLRKQLQNLNQALRGHCQVLLRYAKFGNLQKAPEARGAQ